MSPQTMHSRLGVYTFLSTVSSLEMKRSKLPNEALYRAIIHTFCMLVLNYDTL